MRKNFLNNIAITAWSFGWPKGHQEVSENIDV